MNDYKIGDIVLFSLNGNDEKVKLYKEVGLIIAINNENICVFQLKRYGGATMHKIDINKIRHICEKESVVQEIKEYYNSKIKNNENMIKSIKRSDYKDEIINKYYDLKTQIINTAKNMCELNSDDDTSFENKLKAICQKKKELFSIKCEGLNDARKYNGEIKYNIRELVKERDRTIEYLEEDINKLKEKLEIKELD